MHASRVTLIGGQVADIHINDRLMQQGSTKKLQVFNKPMALVLSLRSQRE